MMAFLMFICFGEIARITILDTVQSVVSPVFSVEKDTVLRQLTVPTAGPGTVLFSNFPATERPCSGPFRRDSLSVTTEQVLYRLRSGPFQRDALSCDHRTGSLPIYSVRTASFQTYSIRPRLPIRTLYKILYDHYNQFPRKTASLRLPIGTLCQVLYVPYSRFPRKTGYSV